MEALYEPCCGLDVHKKTVVACLITPGPRRRPLKEVRTFGTMTDDLLALVFSVALTALYVSGVVVLLRGRRHP